MWAGGCIRIPVSAQKAQYLEFSSMKSSEFRIVSDLFLEILLFEGRGCVKIKLLCRIHYYPSLQIKSWTLFCPTCVDVIFIKMPFCTEIPLMASESTGVKRSNCQQCDNSSYSDDARSFKACQNSGYSFLIRTKPPSLLRKQCSEEASHTMVPAAFVMV